MDEWQLEMQEIRRTLDGLRARRGDPLVMDELEAQLRILSAFYLTAQQLHESGGSDRPLKVDFAAIGMGEWTFPNVYFYVYETAMEVDPGRRELSSVVPEMDFEGMIHDAAEDAARG
jgi:hypothetical protein